MLNVLKPSLAPAKSQTNPLTETDDLKNKPISAEVISAEEKAATLYKKAQQAEETYLKTRIPTDFDQSVQDYRAVLTLNPEHTDAQSALANLKKNHTCFLLKAIEEKIKNGLFSQAQALLKKVEELDNNIDSTEAKSAIEAESAIVKGLAQEQQAKKLEMQARNAYLTYNYELSIQLYTQALALPLFHSNNQRSIQKSLEEVQKEYKSYQRFGRAQKHAAEHSYEMAGIELKGAFELLNGRRDELKKIMTAFAQKMDSSLRPAYLQYEIALRLMNQGSLEEAKIALNKALALNPELEEATNALRAIEILDYVAETAITFALEMVKLATTDVVDNRKKEILKKQIIHGLLQENEFRQCSFITPVQQMRLSQAIADQIKRICIRLWTLKHFGYAIYILVENFKDYMIVNAWLTFKEKCSESIFPSPYQTYTQLDEPSSDISPEQKTITTPYSYSYPLNSQYGFYTSLQNSPTTFSIQKQNIEEEKTDKTTTSSVQVIPPSAQVIKNFSS